MPTWAEINEMRGERLTIAQQIFDLKEDYESYTDGMVWEFERLQSADLIDEWIKELEDALETSKQFKKELDALMEVVNAEDDRDNIDRFDSQLDERYVEALVG